MLVVRLTGGLGNQMFRYATARATAHRHHDQLRADRSLSVESQSGRESRLPPKTNKTQRGVAAYLMQMI